MPIFRIIGKKLQMIREISIDLEEELQKVVEENLEQVFGLKFISSEFSLHNFRIDTLGFDEETSSFVIIEYKRDRSFSVIDQGYAYLSLMLNNKSDFILEYNEKCGKNLKRESIDWSQSRVIFVANSFTAYQQNAINFKNLPIELWETKKFDNDTILFNELKSPDSNESIKTITKNKTIENVSREVKKYSLEDHFKENWHEARELFEILSQKIINLDSRFDIHPVKFYIGFNIDNKNVVAVKARSSKLLLELLRVMPKDLIDPDKRTRYIKKSFEYYNKHITQFDIVNNSDIDYAMFLVRQVYEKFYVK